MDITLLNRKIFDDLSEAEKSRILRFLTESDKSKLSNTILRYIETKPNFVKQFFSELLRIRDNGSLSLITHIINDYFDEVIKFFGEKIIYDLIKANRYDSSILFSILLCNYDKFSQDLKENVLSSFFNNIECIDFIYFDSIYYKFPENIRSELLFRSLDFSVALLNSIYKTLDKDIQEKTLDILISKNNTKILTSDFIEFIINNFLQFPENKKQFFLDKLVESAYDKTSDIYCNSFSNLNKLYELIPNDYFISILRIFINKDFLLSVYCPPTFLDKIDADLRNQIFYKYVPLDSEIEKYKITHGLDFPSYERNYDFSSFFKTLNDKNLNNALKFLLDHKVKIEFLINSISENLRRLDIEIRKKALEEILISKKEIPYIFRCLLKNLAFLPDTVDFFIKFAAYNEIFLKKYKYEFINTFNSFDELVKKKLLESPVTKKISYIAINRNISFTSEDEINIFIKNLTEEKVSESLISTFASNYSKFPEDLRLDILKKFVNISYAKRHISRIIFENFDLISKDTFSFLIENLIDSEDKKVYFYLAQTINEFSEKISSLERDLILEKIIKFPENIDIVFLLMEDNILNISDDLLKILFSSKLNKNLVKKISKTLFTNTTLLSDRTFNYLIFLSSDFFYSRYIVWDFINSYNNIPEKLREKLLENFIKTENTITTYTLILALLDSDINLLVKKEILLKIIENNLSLDTLKKLLINHFDRFDEDIKLKFLMIIYFSPQENLFLLEFLVKNYTFIDIISRELSMEPLKLLNSIAILEKLSVSSIEKLSINIKKNFLNYSEDVKNKFLNILFYNYYSRKIATLIIIENSKKLPNEINSLLISIINENNLIISEIENISLEVKEKIIKKVLITLKPFIIKKIYFVNLKEITLNTIFEQVILFYYSNKNLNNSVFEESLSRLQYIKPNFSLDQLKDKNKYINALNSLFLSIIFSEAFNHLIIKEIKEEKNLDENTKLLPLKIFYNMKSINIIATKLRLDFHKFDEKTRNELLILLANYKPTDYLFIFVYDAVKYNIDNIPRDITLEIIKKLRLLEGHYYYKAEDLNKLLKHYCYCSKKTYNKKD